MMQVKGSPRKWDLVKLYTGRGGDAQHRSGRWRGRLGQGTVERIDGKDEVHDEERRRTQKGSEKVEGESWSSSSS